MTVFRSAILTLGCLLLAGPATAQNKMPVVKSGQSVVLRSIAAYDPTTCLFAALPIITVAKQPANGTVVVEKTSFTLGNDTRCSGTAVKGTQVVYKSKPGYRGPEQVIVETSRDKYINGPGSVSSRNVFDFLVQ